VQVRFGPEPSNRFKFLVPYSPPGVGPCSTVRVQITPYGQVMPLLPHYLLAEVRDGQELSLTTDKTDTQMDAFSLFLSLPPPPSLPLSLTHSHTYIIHISLEPLIFHSSNLMPQTSMTDTERQTEETPIDTDRHRQTDRHKHTSARTHVYTHTHRHRHGLLPTCLCSCLSCPPVTLKGALYALKRKNPVYTQYSGLFFECSRRLG